MSMRHLFLVLLALLVGVNACRESPPLQSAEPLAEAPAVKNVILMIGDGMGPQQLKQAIRYRQVRRSQEAPLAFEELSEQGTRGDVRTESHEALVTDSAAAATAMACGLKTRNRVVGLDPQGRPCETIVDLAERSGRAIGVVTNTDVTDATPAAFLSHVSSRDQHRAIAQQYLEAAQVDLLMGGGLRYFDPAVVAPYQWIDSLPQLSGLVSLQEPGVIALFAEEHFPYAQKIDRGDRVPDLARLTSEAIRLLSAAPQGFLLIVEGGLIDKAAHNNDAGTQLRQMLEFDAALRVAFDFAKRAGETLLIVTADHETGGFAFSNDRVFEVLEKQEVSFPYLMGPILDRLYQADDSSGTPLTQEEAAAALKKQLEEWTAYEITMEQAREVMAPVSGPLQGFFDHFEGFWLSSRAVHIARLARLLGTQNASTYTTGGHTSEPVPILSWGPAAHTRFLSGQIDNTEIAVVIRRALGAGQRAGPKGPKKPGR